MNRNTINALKAMSYLNELAEYTEDNSFIPFSQTGPIDDMENCLFHDELGMEDEDTVSYPLISCSDINGKRRKVIELWADTLEAKSVSLVFAKDEDGDLYDPRIEIVLSDNKDNEEEIIWVEDGEWYFV